MLCASALNPVDWKVQKYGNPITIYPAVIGSDSSGEVVEVGEGVTNFIKGDRV
jgi:NADPH:quinone reductase-like Zn-dependent oxidoreductase